jgi:transcriptional regulator with XRE-family HTH domain
MKINAARVREERKARQWSQEQLADACGLNLRTIQRLEASGNASSESLRALAAVFELEASALAASRRHHAGGHARGVRAGLAAVRRLQGHGHAGRVLVVLSGGAGGGGAGRRDT